MHLLQGPSRRLDALGGKCVIVLRDMESGLKFTATLGDNAPLQMRFERVAAH
jgi:hypothetical protein